MDRPCWTSDAVVQPAQFSVDALPSVNVPVHARLARSEQLFAFAFSTSPDSVTLIGARWTSLTNVLWFWATGVPLSRMNGTVPSVTR
jgi:hypothetical protein